MKRKALNKKRMKGMTLLEVVIAIAVFAIAATLLVEAGLSIIYNVRSSRNLVRKVNFQSKIVACKPNPDSDDIVTNDVIDDMSLSLAVEGGPTGQVDVNGYEAVTEVDEDGNSIYDNVAGNLKFFTLVPEAEVE